MKKEINEDWDIQDVVDECEHSEKFLMFAAIITDKRDAEGNNMIDFRYRRNAFAIEDAKQAIKHLERFVNDELARMTHPEGFNGGA